jgi:hypothetical protein
MFAKIKKAIKTVAKIIRKVFRPRVIVPAVIGIVAIFVAIKIMPLLLAGIVATSASNIESRPKEAEGFTGGVGFGGFDIFDERPGKDGRLIYHADFDDKVAVIPKDASAGLAWAIKRYALLTGMETV